jgi:iron complex outermembrane receptor protein
MTAVPPLRHRSPSRLLASTMLSGALAAIVWTPGARAEAPADTSNPSTVEEIVVTGSLIRRTSTETPSPVTVLSADQLAKQGIVTIADAVRSISADNSGTVPEAFSNGFASGSSGVALRGLTVNSTLVLIDGLRTSNYPLADDGERGFVDLNTIPFSAVQRVEVLKDGASSIYGADAIGGVVNIIMKPTFQGAEGEIEYGGTQHGGGFSQRYSATVGQGNLDTDHYNAYINFEYEGDDRIRTTQRSFPYNTNDLSSIGGQNNIGGQPGLFSGSIYGSVTPATLGGGSILNGSALSDASGNQLGSQPLRACGAGSTQQSAPVGPGNPNLNVYCAQNFLSYGDIAPAETRYGILARFTAQLNPDTQAFFTASYYTNQTVVDQQPQQIQTSTPNNTNAIALPAVLADGLLNPNDPFAAAGQAALINYAFGDIPSQLTETNHVYRLVTGIKGAFSGWSYSASIDVNHSSLETRDSGYILYSQLISDINSGAYSFIDPASNSAAVRSALSPTLAKTSTTDLDSLDVSATRALYTLPGGPLSIAVGGQFRYEATNDPDLNPMSGYQGLGVAHTVGNRTVGGVFAELEAPVLKSLEINLSGRYDHYSDAGGNFSPKIGAKFTPIRQIALRATYSEGFRAPSFSENGASASEGFITYSPQASAPDSFNTAHNNDAYTQQYSLAEYTVANPNIKPETSKSYTLGAIIEPVSFLNFSVDYYHISKKNVIAQSDPGAILAAYFAGTPLPAGGSVVADIPDPQAPNALARPLIVESPYVNANALETDGLDVDVRIRTNLPLGIRFTSELNFTDIFTYNFTAGGSTYSYVGTQAPYILSSGAGTPKYRANWSNSFTKGRATVTGTLYYVSGLKETGVDATGDPSACLYSGADGSDFPTGCKVGEFWDFDLTGSYRLSDRIEIYADIANLTDAKPPLDPADYAGGGANYNPTYAQAGIIGRAFKIGLRVSY